MMTGKRRLRFAFDVGTNSIGWAVYELEQAGDVFTICKLHGCGVRLFGDGRNPKDGRSLAEMRRVPRAARRRRDRYVLRRRDLIAQLVDCHLLPDAEADRRKLGSLDPYALRAKGLDSQLTEYEIGRVLLHFNRRRGFKSNRRTDRKANERGKISEGAERLRERLAAESARTLGEYLWRRHGGSDGKLTPRTRLPVRIRLDGSGAKALYDIYPTRKMLQHEFDQLMAAQAHHYSDVLTPELVSSLRHTIFRQRDLKPVPVGRCTLEPTEPRLPKALPSVEARTIYETLNQLRFGEGLSLDSRLDRTSRDLFAATLLQGKSLTFDKLRATLKIPGTTRFSLEESGKRELKDFASKSAAAMSKQGRFGSRWHNLTLEQRDAIVRRMLDEDSEEALVAWLTSEHAMEESTALAVARWAPPEGTARLGPTGNAAILAELRADHLCTYSEAVRRAGERLGRPWHHSNFGDGEIQIPLPYYGKVLERHVLFPKENPKNEEEQYGRLPNPTVHIGLGQLRRLVNRLIEAYGEPVQIIVELARELKLSSAQKDEEQKRNRENRQANELRRQQLEKLGQADTGENRLRLRLFEEQQRANDGVALCPYSLAPIGIEKLFSSEVDIDHILPYSRTLDDTAANRVICYRAANRMKRTKSPHDAFSSLPQWQDIVARAAGLPKNKRWRFAPDAMERFERTERNFLARQINETRHLSRLARLFLGAACGPDNVYVTTGQLTAMLRARWGLNSILGDENRKVRTDHRHHAIDAVVVGAIDRSLLQEMSRRAGRAEAEDRRDITRDVPEPFPGFREAVREKVHASIVSVKAEHGNSGALHEDTAYGQITDEEEAAKIGNLVYRKPLRDLTAVEIQRIRDARLRKEVLEIAMPFLVEKGKKKGAEEEEDVESEDDKAIDGGPSNAVRYALRKGCKNDLKAVLERFASENAPGRECGVRRVRIGKAKAGEVHIKDRRNGSVYKALIPGENHHIDIVQMRDGTWKGFAATVFEVNQKEWRPIWERDKVGGKLVMRIHKGDMIEVDRNGSRTLMVVHRLSPSNNVLYLAPHNEGGDLARRHSDEDDSFRWDFANIGGLRGRKARMLNVDEIGRLRSARTNISG